MLQDALELPIGGNAELGADEETGLLGGLWHIDGATLYPTYDRDITFVQINPYNGLDRVYFQRGDLMRLRLQPRVDLVKKQYQEAPVESAFTGIEALSRIYTYYLKQLGDTPMVGILDVMDMTPEEATDWAVAFREMLEGIDPLKIPLLYDHTKPARFIPFTRSPQDLNIIENFKRFAEMVASAFGLSIGDLRMFEHERVLAGVEASQRVTARSGIGFYAQAIEDMINQNILFSDESGITFGFKLGMTGEEQQKAQLALTRSQIIATLVGPSTPVLKPEDAQKQLVQWKVIEVEPSGMPAAPGLEGLGGLLGGGESGGEQPGGGSPSEGGPPGEEGSVEDSLQKINAAADEMGQYKHLPGRHNQKEHGRVGKGGDPELAGDGPKESIEEARGICEEFRISRAVVEKIHVVSDETYDDVIGMTEGQETAGATKPGEIWIRGNMDAKKFRMVLLHELGHKIDYLFPSMRRNLIKHLESWGEKQAFLNFLKGVPGGYKPEAYDKEIFAMAYSLALGFSDEIGDQFSAAVEFFSAKDWPPGDL